MEEKSDNMVAKASKYTRELLSFQSKLLCEFGREPVERCR